MPSAEMRRNTRVFGARVLRSGRRVWTGPGEVRHMKTKDGEEWIELLENSDDGGGDSAHCKENGWNINGGAPEHEVIEMDVDKEVETQFDKVAHENLVTDKNVGRRWGIVYSRKRKKVNYNHVDCSSNIEELESSMDKMYGKHFIRRKWRKKIRRSKVAEPCDSNVACGALEELQYSSRCQILAILVKSFCTSRYKVTCFLNSVLRYLRRARVEIKQLSAFLFSKTIAHVYSSCGVQFLQDDNLIPERGVCMIWDASFIPVFSVDFSAVPFCFLHLHSSMQLRFVRLTCILGIYSLRKDETDDDKTTTSCLHIEKDQDASVVVTSRIHYSGKTMVLPSNIKATKLAGQTAELRNGCNIQKRSSLRSKRGRPPSASGVGKANGALASNICNFRQDGVQLPSMLPDHAVGSSAQRNTCLNVKQVKSAVLGLAQAVHQTSCYANILIIESDKCYREEGVLVTLEGSAKKQWHLAIKRDGVQRMSIIAQKVMRPSSCNRFTHAIIWTADNGWKLEFPDRREWLTFKDMYKECSDRNVHVPVESFIPIPGVREVPDCVNSSCDFARPALYISLTDDELTRALARRTANYDMDSDDEEWLNKFNTEFFAEKENCILLSDEIFELMIDAFERGFHCNPDDYCDETTAPNICINGDRRVVEAVHSHWIRKRRQKRSALLRVFKYYQPRKAQLIPKNVLRKKRSFKRQGSQAGRGKQRTFLQAMAAEQDAQEQQNAILKVEEAKAAANRSEGLAVLKRQKAQQLMENADLATYKAAMALRIAELAQMAESSEAFGLLYSVTK